MKINSGVIFLGLILIFVYSFSAVTRHTKNNENKDPGEIIIDEFIGQSIPIYLYEISHGTNKEPDQAIIIYFVCFILFRYFDIMKPFPVSYFDQKHKNSFGVIMDDVCAGFYVVLVINLFHDIKKLYFMIESLVKRLIKKKLRISLAESCTGGMLASSITSISGASKVFNLGLVTYSNDVKINILKVNKKIIQKHGAVSAECCEAMVKCLSKISKAHINVSITGIAGPKGGTKTKPVGLVYIGVKKSNKLLITKNLFKKKTRSAIQKSTVNRALELVNYLI